MNGSCALGQGVCSWEGEPVGVLGNVWQFRGAGVLRAQICYPVQSFCSVAHCGPRTYLWKVGSLPGFCEEVVLCLKSLGDLLIQDMRDLWKSKADDPVTGSDCLKRLTRASALLSAEGHAPRGHSLSLFAHPLFHPPDRHRFVSFFNWETKWVN